MFTARHYIQAALYHVIPRCASLVPFLDYATGPHANLPFDKQAARTVVSSILSSSYVEESSNISERILRRLISRDAALLQPILSDEARCAAIDSEADFNNVMYATLRDAITIFNEKDIDIEVPELYFVEQFPKPYDRQKIFALNLDEGDANAHGVSIGIYFLKELRRPVYSRYLLLHELVHTILGKKDPEILARGLEEGLCELVGAVYLSSRILGWDVTTSLYIYNRLFAGGTDHINRYIDYTRQASILLQNYGWDGIFELLKRGRRAIKFVEQSLFNGEWDDLDLPRGEIDLFASKRLMLCTGVFSKSFVCSPAALIVSEVVKPGDTVREVARKAEMPFDVTLAALHELHDEFNYVVLREDNSVVSFSDCHNIVSPMNLRYIINAN